MTFVEWLAFVIAPTVVLLIGAVATFLNARSARRH
jgi:hypothetical protein